MGNPDDLPSASVVNGVLNETAPPSPAALDAVELQNLTASPPLPRLCFDKFGFFAAPSPSPNSTPVPETKSVEKLKSIHDATAQALDEEIRRWDSFIRELHVLGIGDMGLRGSFLPERLQRQLVQLVESSGIPAKYRNGVWFELSGARGKIVHGEYHRLLGEVRRGQCTKAATDHFADIELDLHRTWPSSTYFGADGPHAASLRDILYAYVLFRPNGGYSQGMNKLVGNLLLAVGEGNGETGLTKLSDEEIFWMLVSITDHFVPRYGDTLFMDRRALALVHDDLARVQHDLLGVVAPDLARHFRHLGTELAMFAVPWWLGFFTEAFVSMESWFRVVDLLLVAPDANAKFVCYTLALLKVFEPKLLKLPDTAAIYSLMNNLDNPRFNQKNLRFNDMVPALHAAEAVARQ